MFLIDGAYHVLFAVGQICEVCNVDRFNKDAAISYIPKAIDYISELIVKAQAQDESFSFNRFFKDSKTKTKIASYVNTKENIV